MQASSALTASSTITTFADAPVQTAPLPGDAPVLLSDDELMCVAGGSEQLPVSTW